MSGTLTAVPTCLPEHQQVCDFYPILQHLSKWSKVHVTLPWQQTVFLGGYQCCFAIAWRVKICTQQQGLLMGPTETSFCLFFSILRYWVCKNLPTCISGIQLKINPLELSLAIFYRTLCAVKVNRKRNNKLCKSTFKM